MEGGAMVRVADPRVFTIGRAAQLAGVSPSTLRRLEAAGAIRPARVEGTDLRVYTEDDMATIRQVVGAARVTGPSARQAA
jgi:DNA-binding transcriptional MerR regulator